ncbi:MAG: hypothetical protein JXA82_19345 [Sedimentisphaerales bacterium]|nr:hypothetical protein [Sedimentisphaerales bacterium]
MERHIGQKVVIEILEKDTWIEYVGVLKDYTSDFIEILDVNYSVKQSQHPMPVDMIIPRNRATVRHLGE